jgi:hypothetical protein
VNDILFDRGSKISKITFFLTEVVVKIPINFRIGFGALLRLVSTPRAVSPSRRHPYRKM